MNLDNQTTKVLNDLRNRIEQFCEISEYNMKNPDRYELSFNQLGAFNSVLALIDQIKQHGKINRGNEFFPDPIETYRRDVMKKTLL